MNNLLSENCVKVGKGTAALPINEASALLASIPGWEITDRNGTPSLVKSYKFPNFAAALSFTNRVGQQAEDQDHHPAILTEWGRVTVSWWTHVAHGLHRNDFIMAARTDAVFQSFFSD